MREDKTIAELCEQFELHPNQITEWKQQLLDRAAEVFDISRGTFYYLPRPVSSADLMLTTRLK